MNSMPISHWGLLPLAFCSRNNHHLMANIWEKAISISTRNLNLGRTYLTTTVSIGPSLNSFTCSRIKTFSRDYQMLKCTRCPGENCSEMFTGCQYNLSCASSYVFVTWTDVLGRAFVISVLFSRENSWKWSRQMMTSNSGGGRARRSLPRRSPDHRC